MHEIFIWVCNMIKAADLANVGLYSYEEWNRELDKATKFQDYSSKRLVIIKRVVLQLTNMPQLVAVVHEICGSEARIVMDNENMCFRIRRSEASFWSTNTLVAHKGSMW